MATPVADAMQDTSIYDGTGTAIVGSQIDTNPSILAQVLDGTLAKTLGSDGGLTFSLTYANPLVSAGGGYLWYDATNTCWRTQHGSAPSAEDDGLSLMEG